MHKTTNINKSANMDETAQKVSSTTQESAYTAINYAFKAQEINTDLLRRTSQAWIEGFRFQARLSQEMAQAFFGRWGDAFTSTMHVERPAQEQSRSEVATNGTQKDTEVAAEDARQKAEKAAKETQKAADIATKCAQNISEPAAEDVQKNTATATFPIEGYDEMNVGEASERLDGLSGDELKRVMKYEKRNKNRRSLRKEMKQKIKTTS